MGNSLLAVRGINHKYIVVEGEKGDKDIYWVDSPGDCRHMLYISAVWTGGPSEDTGRLLAGIGNNIPCCKDKGIQKISGRAYLGVIRENKCWGNFVQEYMLLYEASLLISRRQDCGRCNG